MYMLGVLPRYKYLFTDESKSYVANSALEYGFKHGTFCLKIHSQNSSSKL